MGVDPSRCAVVEDSVPGVVGAVAAGMTAFGYAAGFGDTHQLVLSGAKLFDAMEDLIVHLT